MTTFTTLATIKSLSKESRMTPVGITLAVTDIGDLVVKSVVADSLAQKAGLKPGLLVIAINDVPAPTIAQAGKLLKDSVGRVTFQVEQPDETRSAAREEVVSSSSTSLSSSLRSSFVKSSSRKSSRLVHRGFLC